MENTIDKEQQKALLHVRWTIKADVLEAEFSFDDFKQALSFVNKVGELAEQEQHHPDVVLGYGRVNIKLSTHDAGGLTQKDFTLAQKIDTLL